MMKHCPDCGGNLVEKKGTYRFMPPSNIPGGMMIVPNAVWLECKECLYQLLPSKLDDELDKIAKERTRK